ncbi:hypothetical protein D2N39_11435 [Gemmobacter lutimaris]|uniref:Uncharacterized protein n=1 Tax=Gemmobacter lutimaris TaxID=2306023 RepID=A0A398BX17_9RHOB|nr:hypothetical protein [Gemmobacter lutimaris]RID91843.1 hypothetical protein D2N39_11435 [Gemmobacter lutimaris]
MSVVAHCDETRRRVRLTLWAYAYEFRHDALVPDAVFDAEARRVDLSRSTSRPDLDQWWRDNFDPSTGVWIRRHPELTVVARLYVTLKRAKRAWLIRSLFRDVLG